MSHLPLTGPMLFAHSQGLVCQGRWRCHWCGSPCHNDFIHDDPPPIPFIRSNSTAKCPGESYICAGCWRWRRGKTTVNFLDGHYQDGQLLKQHSWWITEETALAVAKGDGKYLYPLLLKPPKRFTLMLLDGQHMDNLLQLAVANDPGGIIAETPLHFTLNNIPHTFSIYEMEEAVRYGPEAYGPGVRALFAFLGKVPDEIKQRFPPPDKEADRKGRGRPQPKDDAKYTTKRLIVASGG